MFRSTYTFCFLVASFGLFSSVAFADVTADQCIDANAKAQGLARDGKLVASREQLVMCVDTHCPAIVRDDCARRLDELDRLQPTIVFDAKDAAGNDVLAATVKVDGRRLADKLDGSPLAVDPGAHAFTFEVAGQPPVTRTFVLREGEKGRNEHVVVGAGASGAARPRSFDGVPRPDIARRGMGGQKVGALAIGGVGIAGIAVGSVFGVLASSAWNKSKSECSATSCPPDGHAQAVADHTTTVTFGTVSTVAFIAGGVLAAGGVVLFLTAPRVRIEPSLGPASAGVLMRGEF